MKARQYALWCCSCGSLKHEDWKKFIQRLHLGWHFSEFQKRDLKRFEEGFGSSRTSLRKRPQTRHRCTTDRRWIPTMSLWMSRPPPGRTSWTAELPPTLEMPPLSGSLTEKYYEMIVQMLFKCLFTHVDKARDLEHLVKVNWDTLRQSGLVVQQACHCQHDCSVMSLSWIVETCWNLKRVESKEGQSATSPVSIMSFGEVVGGGIDVILFRFYFLHSFWLMK